MLVRQGDKGQVVKALQAALGLTADGDFGPGTLAAVRDFQTRHGLTADGVAGPSTLGAAGVEPLDGVDVSHYQTGLDWSRMAAAGVGFAYVKASQGVSSDDDAAKAHLAAARAAGLKVGCYHFAAASRARKAKDEAAWYVKTAQGLGALDLPAVLDLESNPDGLGVQELQAWALAWLQAVGKATGKEPILYTGQAFIRGALGGGGPLAGYRLWVARYTGAADPGDLGDWPGWAIWQWSTAAGMLPGAPGPIDRNRMFGGRSALDALCA